jgi:plasmid stabilization system protein ParE
VDFKVRITDQAPGDLEEILEYSWDNFPELTERFGLAVLDHIALLERFPRMGTPVPRSAGVRKLQHTPISIYYRLDEARNLIEILHFWHGARRRPLPE